MTMSRRMVTCLHEAAHAVVRVSLGLPFEVVEVYDDPTTGADGYMTVINSFPLCRTQDQRAAVVSALASIPCELWLDPAYGYRPRQRQPRSNHGIGRFLIVSTTSCRDDFDQAREMAEDFGLSLENALDDAFELVHANWHAIVRVADVLNAAGVLSCNQVRALVTPVAEKICSE